MSGKRIHRWEYLKALRLIKEYEKQVVEDYKEVKSNPVFGYERTTKFIDTPLSVRTLNCLRWLINERGLGNQAIGSELNNEFSILEDVSVESLMKIRSFGKGSLKQIQDACKIAGVEIGKNVIKATISYE